MMDSEQNKTIKAMRNAIKNGNLGLVKELPGNDDSLLEVNTVFGSWLHIAASYGRVGIAAYYSIGEPDKVDICEYAKQLRQTEISSNISRV